MMALLGKIVDEKRREVAGQKQIMPVEKLMDLPMINRQTNSLKERLLHSDPCGIIAEFKRKSPSRGIINESVSVREVVRGYEKAGAAGISVLTDRVFFGGSTDDLKKARAASLNEPILRKEFMIDEYQVIEAKAFGADVILLIAELLSADEVRHLAGSARALNLEVILEMHHEDQLYKICEEVDIVGINNRDLGDFSVNINTSLDISGKIPGDRIKISESGLNSTEAIAMLTGAGYRGVLIGEYFMLHPKPWKACAELIHAIRNHA